MPSTLYLTLVRRFENKVKFLYVYAHIFEAHGRRGAGRFNYDEPPMSRMVRRIGRGCINLWLKARGRGLDGVGHL